MEFFTINFSKAPFFGEPIALTDLLKSSEPIYVIDAHQVPYLICGGYIINRNGYATTIDSINLKTGVVNFPAECGGRCSQPLMFFLENVHTWSSVEMGLSNGYVGGSVPLRMKPIRLPEVNLSIEVLEKLFGTHVTVSK